MSLHRVATTLRTTAGLEPDALGARHLGAAVERLAGRAGVDVEAYAALVASDPTERERLVAELLVHETSFFRYPASFRHLSALGAARAATGSGPVRVLCVACATGQEAYSAAVALLDAGLAPERVVVDAYDRSPAAVEQARAGRFDRGAARGLEGDVAARWFRDDAGVLEASAALRARVRFEIGDLLDAARPFPGGRYDAVFCRNLLIYLTEDARGRALAALRAALAPDGVLYLGHAEVLVARAHGFQPLPDGATYACVPRATAEGSTRADAGPALRTRVATRPGPASRPGPAAAARVPAVPVAPVSEVPSPPTPVVPPADRLATARALADAGRLDEAAALVEQELASGRPSADHFHLLALVLRAAGRARAADDALGRALYLDPSHVGALLLAAVAAEGRGEPAVAARLRERGRVAATGGR